MNNKKRRILIRLLTVGMLSSAIICPSDAKSVVPTIEIKRNNCTQEKIPLQCTIVPFENGLMINYAFIENCIRSYSSTIKQKGHVLEIRLEDQERGFALCGCNYEMQLVVRNLTYGRYKLRLFRYDSDANKVVLKKSLWVKVPKNAQAA